MSYHDSDQSKKKKQWIQTGKTISHARKGKRKEKNDVGTTFNIFHWL